MGRLLGAHDDGELDRPDLNKCPDCGSFFAPDSDTCPICGTFCPEEYRAGNRKVQKVKKQKFSRASSRVTFVEWYHSFWFIALALAFMPLIGIVLLITSPHKTKHKVIFVAAAALYTVLVTYGVGGLLWRYAVNLYDNAGAPVTAEDYAAEATAVSAEQFYRMTGDYTGVRISLALTVAERITDVSADGYGMHPTYYLCTDEEGRVSILVHARDDAPNLLAGDRITVLGIGIGNITVTDTAYLPHTAPCVDAAYIQVH